MIYDLIDQQVLDIIWHALDREGRVLQFASGGGRIPNSVAKDVEGIRQVFSYVQQLPHFDNNEVMVNMKFVDRYNFAREDSKNEYIARLNSFSKNGIVVFDKMMPPWEENASYCKEATPQKILTVDMTPDEIQEILSRTVLDFDAINSDFVSLKKLNLIEDADWLKGKIRS